MSSAEHLVIVGASARAAAFSALRAGLRPWCADLFADLDLQARCPVRAVPASAYPEGILDALADAPPGPVLYTGALENRPSLVRRLTEHRPLWGNDSTILQQVRSPLRVQAALKQHGFPCLNVLAKPQPEIQEGRWLLKPLKSAGGSGIRFWDGRTSLPKGTYLQQYLEGESRAALFVGDGCRADFLGCTWQLVGEPWLHAAPFHYCGSVGPLALPPEAGEQLRRLGDALAGAFRLRGLFGVDCVLWRGDYYPVEINPRYTASVEVLEYAGELVALDCHRRTFERASMVPPVPVSERDAKLVGKAVLYAARDLTFPADGPWLSVLRRPQPVEALPAFADIPAAGQRIPAGRPILTFFAQGRDEFACRAELRTIAADLDHWLKNN